MTPDSWLPIETAPKDGRRILLCCKCHPKVIIGRFHDHWHWVDEQTLTREPIGWQPLPPPKEAPDA